jgi:hypothetical protein
MDFLPVPLAKSLRMIFVETEGDTLFGQFLGVKVLWAIFSLLFAHCVQQSRPLIIQSVADVFKLLIKQRFMVSIPCMKKMRPDINPFYPS